MSKLRDYEEAQVESEKGLIGFFSKMFGSKPAKSPEKQPRRQGLEEPISKEINDEAY